MLRSVGVVGLGSALATKDAPIIGGQGAWQYQYEPTMLQMPDGVKAGDYHGLAVDKDLNIHLTYTGNEHCLVRWSPDDGYTKPLVMGPGADLCQGTPHGLRLSNEGDEVFLYHANNNQALHKTKLDGTLVWTITGLPGNDTTLGPYKPTWFDRQPNSNYLYLADGYGSSKIHVYTLDGKFTGNSFGGRGSDHGQFSTCHAISWDDRRGQMAVSDRENHRIEYFNIDPEDPTKFEYESTSTVDGIQRPCNIRFLNENAIIPALEGPVAILDKDNKLLSSIDVAGLLGDQGFKHPHDAHMLPNGDFVVGTWNPGRIAYWRRLPSAVAV